MGRQNKKPRSGGCQSGEGEIRLLCGVGGAAGVGHMFPPIEDGAQVAPEHQKGDNGHKKIGDGLGVKDGPGAEGHRQSKQGHKVNQLAAKGEGQRQPHLAHSGEGVHKFVLSPQRDDKEGADADGPHGLGGQIGALGEQPHKQGTCQPGQHKQHRGVAHAQLGDELAGAAHPVALAGAVVEAQQPLGAAADAAEGHGDNEHKALGDGGAGDQHITLAGAAEALEHGVHGNDHHIVHGDDDKGGKAKGEHLPDNAQAVPPELQVHRQLFAAEHPQHIGAAGALGDDGGQSAAPHPHVQPEDEDGVQDDVGHRAQHHAFHACLGIALADDELVQAGGHQSKGRAQQIDEEVLFGIGVGGFGSAEGRQNHPPQGQNGGHDQGAEYPDQQKAVGEYLFGIAQVAFSHADAHQRGAAHAHQRGDGAHHGDHRAADAHPRQGHVADFGDVADIHAVHDAVQHADELGQHTGDGDAPYQRMNIVFAEIVFDFHRKGHLPC